ncbi:hypothetical protein ACP4OV_007297 [Aristida adscensionis]
MAPQSSQAMQLRSGRRLISPPPVRRCRPRRCLEDRFSALPNDLRLDVLGRLEHRSHTIVRTSVLSSTWRNLWTELREFEFNDIDPDQLVDTLAQVKPKIKRLFISFSKDWTLTAVQISSLLRAAHRLEPENFIFWADTEHSGGAFELPCFKRATLIHMDFQRLEFTLPSSEDFPLLEQLYLRKGRVDFGALLPRCPRLSDLMMDYSDLPKGINIITIHSESLRQLALWFNRVSKGLIIDIRAPGLKKFALSCSPVFNMLPLPPTLEEFSLQYNFKTSRVGFAGIWDLNHLKTVKEFSNKTGQAPLVVEHVLCMTILTNRYRQLVNRSFAQEISRLAVPYFSVLVLRLRTRGHVFGPLMLQLLQIGKAIKKLKMVLLGSLFRECVQNCGCDQDSSWRNEQICLPNLQVVEIQGFKVADHELEFLGLLFRSAPMLKRVTIELSYKVSANNERYKKLQAIFEANASVECSVMESVP